MPAPDGGGRTGRGAEPAGTPGEAAEPARAGGGGGAAGGAARWAAERRIRRWRP